MDAAALWRTRVTWALVGAGVTLAITSIRERDEAPPPHDRDALASAAAPADVAPVVDAPLDVPGPPSGDLGVIEALPAAPPAIAVVEPSVPPEASPSAPVATTDAAPTPEPPPAPAAPTEAFEIPLPMMPGARVMKRSQRPDEEHGGVIHTLAISVPAPGAQVEAFYRSALADAKLAVSGGSTTRTTMGSGHRSSLRGKGRDARVHVNLQQRAHTLRTIVRIIWQRLP